MAVTIGVDPGDINICRLGREDHANFLVKHLHTRNLPLLTHLDDSRQLRLVAVRLVPTHDLRDAKLRCLFSRKGSKISIRILLAPCI